MKTVINDLYKTFTKNTQKLFDVDQLEQFFSVLLTTGHSLLPHVLKQYITQTVLRHSSKKFAHY